MAKRNSQSDHDLLIRKTIEDIIKIGHCEIRADLPDYKHPDMFNNHIPDVTGKVSCWLFIFEVETDDSINDSHTEMQWKAFAKYANDNNEKFILVIPQGSKKKAENRLKELELSAQIKEIELTELL